MKKHDGNGRRLVIVTGCDSGIGKSLTDILLSRGYDVLSTYLQPPDTPLGNNHHIIRLDLRDESSIGTFVRQVLTLASGDIGFYALINNAGKASAAPLETLSMETLREIFEVNFFGMVSLTKKLVPLLIREKGRIIIVGSTAGRIALPYFMPYCASKFAVAGFADSLRRELSPFGVQTVLAEPRSIATPIWDTTYAELESREIPEEGKKYETEIRRGGKYFVSAGQAGLSPEKAAKMIADILEKPNPASRYIISRNRPVVRLLSLVPAKLADLLIGRIFGR